MRNRLFGVVVGWSGLICVGGCVNDTAHRDDGRAVPTASRVWKDRCRLRSAPHSIATFPKRESTM